MTHRFGLFLPVLFVAACASPGGEATVATSEPVPPKRARPPRKAGLRAESRLKVERDEHGQIPHDALMIAKRRMATLRTEGTAGGLDSAKWTEVGPGNIGGRIRGICIHPTNPNTIFIGSVSGGIWKSTNGGALWARVDDKMGNLGITSIVMQPGNPSNMYAATGESFIAGARRGAGIFKSTDGGTTWKRLASTSSSAWYFVTRLSFSADGKVLLASASKPTQGLGGGIYRSTDGGNTWTRTSGNSANQRCSDVRFHPTDSNLAVAHQIDYDFNQTAWVTRLLYSSNGGSTWNNATGIGGQGFTRLEIAWHGFGAAKNTVYVQADSGNSEIYRSTDAGRTFTRVATGTGILGRQGDYDNTIWVDPSDTDANPANDVLVAGGIDLFRSTDGGANWTRISNWQSSPQSAHADHHAIVAHPGFNGTTNRTVYFGNDGGIYRADNVYTVQGTNGWTALNNSLGITQFYGGSRNAASDVVYGGTQDNGTLTTSRDSYNAWREPFGGDGGFSASDPTSANWHYGEYVFATIHRWDRANANFAEYIWGDGMQPPYRITEANNANSALFIAPFILDPNNANRMLVGCASLWRSNDVRAPVTFTTGPRWAAIKQAGFELISAIAVAQGDSDTIWVGHDGGEIAYTTNGTAANPTWTLRSNTTPALPARYCTRIVIDPKDKNHVFALFGGYTANNLWETRNAGQNWTAVASFPQIPVRDLEIHPTKSNWLYAATEVGLLVSENGGTTWTSTASNTDVPIDELFFSGDRLYQVTHGRGMFWQTPNAGGTTARADRVGNGCRVDNGNNGPSLAATRPLIGRTTTFSITNAPNPSLGVMLLGGQTTLQVRFGQCLMHVNIALPIVNLGVVPIANGTGQFGLPLPNDASLAGLKLAAQAFVVNTTNRLEYLTNGVNLTLGDV